MDWDLAALGVYDKEPLQYGDDCPSLPANRPRSFPHVVDLDLYDVEETDNDSLTFADGVATFLWNWDKSQFDRFFDLNQSKFELHYDAPDGCINQMTISRDEKTVKAGFRVEGFPGKFEWDPMAQFTIQPDGSWEAELWESIRGQKGNNKDDVEDYGRMVATAILANELWNLDIWPTTTVTVTQ